MVHSQNKAVRQKAKNPSGETSRGLNKVRLALSLPNMLMTKGYESMEKQSRYSPEGKHTKLSAVYIGLMIISKRLIYNQIIGCVLANVKLQGVS